MRKKHPSKKHGKRARRAKGRTPVVRGPQKSLGPAFDAKVDALPDRTPRMRFVERPTRSDGRRFFAFRASDDFHAAVLKAATKAKKYRTQWAREVLAKAAGYKLLEENEDES
jgi:hypothetical protein